MAVRQLKRSLTDAISERMGCSQTSYQCDDDDSFVLGTISMSDFTPPKAFKSSIEEEIDDSDMDSSLTPPHQTRAPPLPYVAMDTSLKGVEGSMNPPLQPPPWKRLTTGASTRTPTATLRVSSPYSAVGSPPPNARRSSRRTSPPPMMDPKASNRAHQRLLTPRVSWSEIVSHSQDQGDDSTSPKTPRFRLRKPSLSTMRAPVRRQPGEEQCISPCGRDQNEGRLNREFTDITVIGKGQFSTVYRARNCLDQCNYAVKKTTQISRRALRRAQLGEVLALANVSMEAERCPNIVRYYSSWFEDGRLHIQTELCGCSLRDQIDERSLKDPSSAPFGEQEVVKVIRDVSNGLDVLHGCNFVHLDIKPDNILVSMRAKENGCYKIADLGLAVAAMGSGCDDVSEGDCRYLAREVLRGDLSNLPKADIFALGLVCYEVATSTRALPCNGDEWHVLRDGVLEVENIALTGNLINLLKRMVRPVPRERPSAKDISSHPSVAPVDEIQALQELMKKQLAEAEQTKKLADSYWQELVHFKRQELLATGNRVDGDGITNLAADCMEADVIDPLMDKGRQCSITTAVGTSRICGAGSAGRGNGARTSRRRDPRRGQTFG